MDDARLRLSPNLRKKHPARRQDRGQKYHPKNRTQTAKNRTVNLRTLRTTGRVVSQGYNEALMVFTEINKMTKNAKTEHFIATTSETCFTQLLMFNLHKINVLHFQEVM